MGCPVAQSTQSSSVDAALSRCPFLHAVAQQQGVEFARQVALAPTVPVNLQAKVPVLEEHYSFDISAQRVHGPNGAVPLARFCTSAPVMELRASDLGHRTPDPSELLRKLAKRKPRPPNDGRVKPPRSSRPMRARAQHSQNPQQPAKGRCPMRKYIEPLGGLLPLIERQMRNMQCPSAIVAARAAVAKTAAVRQLRPQPLLYKMAAVGALAALLNMPFGVWRQHTEKFSLAWFAAVHTPIPFIAIFRKAVVMPKWAMLLTFTAAVAGQAYGAQWERTRLEAGGPALPWAPTNDVLRLACPMTYSQQAERFVDGVCCKEEAIKTGVVHCVAHNTVEVN